MSSLTIADKHSLEKFLGMGGGYVLNFSDRTFGEFMFESANIDIHAEPYTSGGTSKANKLRTYWKLETDYNLGKLILSLLDYSTAHGLNAAGDGPTVVERCRQIASRLLAGAPTLESLKTHAKNLDAGHLSAQIRRMESSVDADPDLAIGTAKELIETVCKTILAERGKPVLGTPHIPTLTKETFKELKLVPDGVPDSARGYEVIKRLLSNLGTVGNGLAELRGLYGSGHGKHAKSSGLKPRHAKLAVGAASSLATFLFETHLETK
ncbi:MAG TPA: abortive infection family protein [Candidatus Saccharimonadales bacterium]|nr:abortive infection family protein [Candidatus Saccharimonadales bacterium]